jgi:hypothetical protein
MGHDILYRSEVGTVSRRETLPRTYVYVLNKNNTILKGSTRLNPWRRQMYLLYNEAGS